MKLLTVVTIVRNGETTIEETLKSVISIKNELVEYIVIDGASTDSTLEIIGKYKRDIDLLISEPDSGIYDAINKGIQKSNGCYIALIHSGDLFLKESISELLKVMEKKEEEIYCTATLMTKEGEDQYIYGRPGRWLLKEMIPHNSSFVPRSIYEKYGLYSLDYKISADYDAFLRFYLKGVNFRFLPLVTVSFNMEGLSHKRADEAKREMEIIKKNYGINAKRTLKTYLKRVESEIRNQLKKVLK